MSAVFCSNCGAKHEYAGFAPNFCSKCGTPLNSKGVQQSSARVQPVKTVSRTQHDDESEDESDVEQLPQIDKLDVEISIEGGFRAFNLEELSKSPQTAQAQKFKPNRRSGIDDLSPQKYGSLKNEAKD